MAEKCGWVGGQCPLFNIQILGSQTLDARYSNSDDRARGLNFKLEILINFRISSLIHLQIKKQTTNILLPCMILI